jgi:CSLREA domain-containing protein
VLPAALAAVLATAMPAAAVIFQVNSTDDEVDATIDGTCASASGACTLRAAVQEAEATTDADEIQLPAGKYLLKLVGVFENSGETGDLDITEDLTINGAGSDLTIVQGKKDRVFDVFGENVVTISNLTITKGAILTNLSSPPEEPEGGGISIYPDATVNLIDVVVSGNKCGDDGGGISNFGHLSLERVTIEKNKSNDDAGGLYNAGKASVASLRDVTIAKNKAKGEGGGIENQALLSLTNVTLSANKSKGDAGGVNNDLGTVTLTNVTLKGNKASKATGGGGALTQQAGSGAFTLRNVVFDGNKPFNCDGVVTPEGGNLESGLSCGLPLDASGFKSLGLGKLADNGGTTQTHALEADSPAVDFGVDANCPESDQRMQARVDIPSVGTTICDSGAYELVVP